MHMKSSARLFAAALIFTGAAAVYAQQATATPEGTLSAVTYSTANVRSGPDTRFEIVAQVPQGASVLAIGRDEVGRWVQVALESGAAGWLPVFVLSINGDLLTLPVVGEERPSGETAQEVTVMAYGRVNVRSEPTINSEIVGQLDVNDQAIVTARSNPNNDWLYVNNDEVRGWVAYFTVRVTGRLDELPVLVPAPDGTALVQPTELVRTRFNIRLHPTPQLDSPTLIVVPFDSEVLPIARTDDGRWLLVRYEQTVGWGVAGLFDITEADRLQLPVYLGTSPTVTPTSP